VTLVLVIFTFLLCGPKVLQTFLYCCPGSSHPYIVLKYVTLRYCTGSYIASTYEYRSARQSEGVKCQVSPSTIALCHHRNQSINGTFISRTSISWVKNLFSVLCSLAGRQNQKINSSLDVTNLIFFLFRLY
jgi:hypothetical protein